MDFGTPKPEQGAIGGGGSVSGPVETSTTKFANDVITASREATVIVDFYSAASPQSKKLSAALEEAVRPYQPAIRLVRLDIDKNPAIAGQLRLQAIPTVYVFRDGRPFDGFAGPQEDHIVKKFVESLAGADAGVDLEAMIVAAEQAVEAGDLQTAAELYANILQQEPQNPQALAGLAQCYLKSGDVARARQTIELVPPDQKSISAVQAVLAALELAEKADGADDTADLLAKLEANPKDHQVRFDLAVALGARGDKSAAVDHLLEIITKDQQWNDEAARKQLLQFFEAWGAKDEATRDGRRRLSSVLFS